MLAKVLNTVLVHLALLGSMPSAVMSQTVGTYPSRPIVMIVPSAVGSGGDVMARMIADDLGRRLGQQVVVENNAGASGTIALRRLAAAKADGYTIAFGTTSTTVVAPAGFPNLGYDPVKDFSPIAGLTASPVLLVANMSAPANNIAEFVAIARNAPQPVLYGTWGPGTSAHFCAEALAQKAGVQLSQVPYKGTSPALMAVLSGEIQYAFLDSATISASVKAGKIKPLAICNSRRSPAYPNLATYREQGIDFDPWLGGGSLLAPAGVPKPILDELSAAAKAFLENPEVNAKLLDWGLMPEFIPGGQYAAIMARGIAGWKVIAKRVVLTNP